jgi:copper chaperone
MMKAVNLKGEKAMTTIKINGMSCNHCVMAVTKALNEIDGIKDVEVDLATGEATFEERGPVDMNAVREAIKKAGYELV